MAILFERRHFACVLTAVMLAACSKGESEESYVAAFPSPDGRFNAVLITSASGGGLAPHCHDLVGIVSASEPARSAKEDRYHVYSAPCDFFANHERAPQIEWLSNDKLRITLSINSTALNGRTVFLKKMDASKAVTIGFVAHE